MPTGTEIPIPEGTPWFAALLVMAVVALAGAVAFMFRIYHRRALALDKDRRTLDAAHHAAAKAWDLERAGWETREVELRAEYELKHREIAQGYEQRLADVLERYEAVARSDRDAHRIREDHLRASCDELVERLAARAAEATKPMTELLQKMQDRLLGGPRRK